MTKREIAEQIRQMKEFGTKMSKKQAVDTLKAAGTILNVEHIDGKKVSQALPSWEGTHVFEKLCDKNQKTG